MNILKKMSIILLFLFCLSCDNRGNEFLESRSSVFKVELSDTVKINQVFTIKVSHYGSSGCASYSRYEIQKNGSSNQLEFFQKRKKGSLCTDNIIELETAISISLDQIGMTELKFKQYGDNYLLDSVFVKN